MTAWASGIVRNLRKSAKKRGVEWSPDVTSAWVREQFERQQGRCFYTGVAFEIRAEHRWMRRPSLDRRDSRAGYTRANTVLVLTAINYLKNDYQEDDVVNLLLEIASLYG